MEKEKKFLNLDNFKIIWEYISSVFARQTYVNSLDTRISKLEQIIEEQNIERTKQMQENI